MNIEQLSVAIRPRTPWEAVDLGFRMGRVWWRPLFAAWLAVSLPVAVALATLLPNNPWWALFILWWMKPLFEHSALFVVSRGVFGELPNWRETLRALPGLWRRSAPMELTLRRVTRTRSLTMPARQLEGLRGKALSLREQVLRREVLATAFVFQLACLVLEISVLLSLTWGMAMFVPGIEWWEGVRLELVSEELNSTQWLHYAFAYVGMWCIGPFYVCGGFGLYINRRVRLEGWDIELVFRRLARRCESRAPAAARAAALLLALWIPIAALPPDAQADPLPASEAQRVIDEIAKSEAEMRWLPRQRESSRGVDLGGLGTGIATGLRALLLIAIVVVLVLLLSKLKLRAPRRTSRGESEAVPESVAGLDIRPESLPDDIVAAARAHWQRGDARGAMSTLYRGALAHFVNRRALVLTESATEGECVREVRIQQQGPVVEDFASLTSSWQRVAYGHERPHEAIFFEHCERWGRHLRAEASP